MKPPGPTDPMTDHPIEHLAPYVEGSLDASGRRAVDDHLATCSTCTEELALAGHARMALASLEEVPAPLGLATPAIQRARPERRWRRPVAWVAGAAAAAAVVVLGITVGLRGPATRSTAEGGAAQITPNGITGGGAGAFDANAPGLAHSTKDYDAASIRTLARDLAGKRTLSSSPPAPAPQEADEVAKEQGALACVDRSGLTAEGGDVLIYLASARYEGTPAYLAGFIRAGGKGVTLWVIARQGCTILTVATQRA